MTNSARFRHAAFLFAALVACLLFARPIAAAEPAPLPAAAPNAGPAPWEDDANLHDIQFVGAKRGWAVGDRGVIWHTADGGQTWTLQKSNVTCALRSLSFLTERVGWIVGGGSVPFTNVNVGVVLFTQDGGQTWQPLVREELPQLLRVKFFSPDRGIAAGQASLAFPSGVLATYDGGRTWQPVAGDGPGDWRGADFPHPEAGIVTGARGRMMLVAENNLHPARVPDFGLRTLAAVKLTGGRQGWLAGDGGLLLQTQDNGLVWQNPPTLLPSGAAEVFDFRALYGRGDRAWVAGAPGSAIWHTPDGGRTWHKQSTPQTVPIAAIAFNSETSGWAVGAMGTMLRTDDGGETWTSVRGAGRRAAFFALHCRPDQVSLSMVTRLSGEAGYRGVVSLLARHDVGPEGATGNGLDLKLQEAVMLAGGSSGDVCWRFPLGIDGLDKDADKLIADWNRRTEGRLGNTLVGHLVRELRMWRPSIVVVNQPAADDAVTRILNQALNVAITRAADSTWFLEQQELAGLQPWQVQKVYARLPVDGAGQAGIDPHEFLPHLGASVEIASARAAGRLSDHPASVSVHEAYRLQQQHLPESANRNVNDFFAGLNLPHGSEARRQLASLNEDGLAARMKIAQRQRVFSGYLKQYLGDPRHAAQLPAQLLDIAGEMPDDQAALQMARLAESYRRTGQWDLAEEVLVKLAERFPHEPPARDAMRWLLQMWTGVEPAWRRARRTGTLREQVTTDRADVVSGAQVPAEPPSAPIRPTAAVANPLRSTKLPGEVVLEGTQDWKTEAVRNWHDQARRMAALLERSSPALARSPEIQFPLAALYRQKNLLTDSEAVYHAVLRTGGENPWQKSARMELWLANPVELPPKAFQVCRPTTERPVLDGLLSDPCWQNADEIALVSEADQRPNPQVHAFVLLSYDDEYLYLAGRFPRLPDTPTDLPLLKGRQHDADLDRFDRVELLLDIDRDYATYYRFVVDQRGWTSEDCWDDATWNPPWYVAADGDAAYWRIEAAIPLKELGPQPPRKNTVWNVRIVRTIPAVGVQSWTHPASSHPRLETAGVVRFE